MARLVPLNARLVPLGASSLGVETKAWQTSTRASDYKKTCSNDLREVHVVLFAPWVSRHQGGKPTIKSLPCSHFALSTNVEELTRLRPIHAQFLERCAQRPGIKNWRLTNFCPTELLRVVGGGVVASPLRFDLDENFLENQRCGLGPASHLHHRNLPGLAAMATLRGPGVPRPLHGECTSWTVFCMQLGACGILQVSPSAVDGLRANHHQA